MTNLIEQVSAEIKTAMKEKNEKRKIALRAIKTSLDNLEKDNKSVTSEMQMSAIQKMLKQRNESATIYKQQNRQDLLEIEEFEMLVLSEFLPKQMDIEEVRVVAKSTISELGLDIEALTQKDFGKIMGVLNKKLSGQTSGQVISSVLKEFIK